MFERYSEAARRVLFMARYEVTNLGAGAIEPEHILLGLCRENRGVVADIFAAAGASATEIRSEIERRAVVKQKIPTSVEVPFSEPTKTVIETAVREADDLHHRFIRPEHLLLAILHDDHSAAASVLRAQGVNLNAARAQVAAARDVDPPPTDTQAGNPFVSGLEEIQELLTHLDVATAGNNEVRGLLERIEQKVAGLKRFFGSV